MCDGSLEPPSQGEGEGTDGEGASPPSDAVRGIMARKREEDERGVYRGAESCEDLSAQQPLRHISSTELISHSCGVRSRCPTASALCTGGLIEGSSAAHYRRRSGDSDAAGWTPVTVDVAVSRYPLAALAARGLHSTAEAGTRGAAVLPVPAQGRWTQGSGCTGAVASLRPTPGIPRVPRVRRLVGAASPQPATASALATSLVAEGQQRIIH